jgi:uncharacterized protein YndB with AHSA1/START domain
MTEPVVHLSKTIPAPADEVWRALTSPELASRYFLGARVESDCREGSPITFSGEWEGKSFKDKGEILEVRPGRRLTYSHYSPSSGEDRPENYHTLTFDLEPRGDEATKVTLTQANLTGGVKQADIDHRADYEKNWRALLDSLSEAVGH